MLTIVFYIYYYREIEAAEMKEAYNKHDGLSSLTRAKKQALLSSTNKKKVETKSKPKPKPVSAPTQKVSSSNDAEDRNTILKTYADVYSDDEDDSTSKRSRTGYYSSFNNAAGVFKFGGITG